MKKLFDIVAIFSGVIGLTSITINASALTPENAAVHSARAITVLVFVLVPFLIARALEKTEIKIPVGRMLRSRQQQHVVQRSPAMQTTYFDYLFQAGTAHEWDTTNFTTLRQRRSTGGSQLK